MSAIYHTIEYELKRSYEVGYILPPTSIVRILKIFSGKVFAETFPNPTLVREEHVK